MTGNLASQDDRWAEIARRVPGFGGWWRDGATAVVMLVDTTQREAALREIGPELTRREIRSVRVQKADFDFTQLCKWKSLVPLDTRSQVTAVDADEVRNRVVVWVADSAHVAPARRRLLGLGIPEEALIVEVMPAIIPK